MARFLLTGTTIPSALMIGILLVVVNGKELDSNYPKECPKRDPSDYVVQLPHETDCTKYYVCQHGKKIVRQCPVYDEEGDRLYFNPESHVCDWPFAVDCEQPEPELPKTLEARKIQKNCPKHESKNQTVHLAHESDCTKFYKCQYGKPIVQDCPCTDDGTRLYFNAAKEICDWSFNVECESDPNLATSCPAKETSRMLRAMIRQAPTFPTKCPKYESKNETVHLAHESDCTKFYKCQYGKPIVQDCPCIEDGTRLYFNKYKQVCDWSFNVECESDSNLATPCPAKETSRMLRAMIRQTPTFPTKCPKYESKNETVHLAHESDCTKFYKCQYGKPIVQDCSCTEDGTRLYFNKYKQVCDWSFNVDCESNPSLATPCSDKNIPATSTERTTTASTEPTPKTSPKTTTSTEPTPVTSPKTTTSTEPTPVTSPKTTTSTKPTSPKNGCLKPCPKNSPANKITPIPHADCRKWCRCLNRDVAVLDCPTDFHFNSRRGTCTSPNTAGCKDHDEPLMNILGYNDRFIW